jgi:putative zinc finger/helix-turn-helix YgiT family protein
MDLNSVWLASTKTGQQSQKEDDEMICINCRKAELATKCSSVAAEVQGETYTIKCEALVCPQCGYTTIGAGQTQEFMRLMADAYRHHHGLLTSSEIKSLRTGLGWSQVELATRTGIGIASIKRWELGKIQDEAMDKLLRLYLDPIHAKEHAKEMGLAKKRSVQSELKRKARAS